MTVTFLAAVAAFEGEAFRALGSAFFVALGSVSFGATAFGAPFAAALRAVVFFVALAAGGALPAGVGLVAVAAFPAVAFLAAARVAVFLPGVAGVSTDFLYRHPEIRSLIERHRAKGGRVPGVRQADAEAPSSTSAAVRALSARLSQQQRAHREEIARLRKALEVAHGENLELRRRLARYEPQ
ncbi:hypothetical protein ACFRKE_01375 [Kitasatospora indigofera]|uniref:hypothetical protein n=1 Tax=Kitasatospora indigofera TaxID=67307 RepID=UPI0036884A20